MSTVTATADNLVSSHDSARLRRSTKNRKRVRSLVFHLCSLALVAVVLYPAVWMLMSSFKPSSEIVGNVSLIPTDATLANFQKAIEGIGGVSFWTFFTNSLILAVGSVVGITLSCSVSAYAFARIEFPGRNVFFALMIGTLLLPFHVVIIPQYIVFNRMGLVDTFVPLLIGKFLAAEAFFVFLMVQFMRNLPRELDEAARIDGAGHVRIFAQVMLPLSVPALATTAIFTFIWTWNDFFHQLIFLTKPDMYTVPIALRSFIDSSSESSWGPMFAMSIVSLIPLFLIFLLGQKYLVKGIATTGIK